MDISSRIRLIQELRSQLLALDWEDRYLVLGSFGFSTWEEDETISAFLAKNDDSKLIALSKHFSPSESESNIDVIPLPMASSRLLIFASHLSTEQALVGSVAYELSRFGVTLFVAHQSIDPDKVWRDEIIETLNACHAGVAFIHAGFKNSDWCPQESGWLLGRPVPVFLLKFDETPTGPLGERQAVDARWMAPPDIAASIIESAQGRPELERNLVTSLIHGMHQSGSFRTTDQVWARLRDFRNLDADQCLKLLTAVEENNQVHAAYCRVDSDRSYKIVIYEYLLKQPGVESVKDRLETFRANRISGV